MEKAFSYEKCPEFFCYRYHVALLTGTFLYRSLLFLRGKDAKFEIKPKFENRKPIIFIETMNEVNSLKPHPSTDTRFTVRYRIKTRDSASIEQEAKDITIEQTIEAPLECATESILQNGVIGRVESITSAEGGDDTHDVDISYRCDITGYSTAQLLNVIYGNISLKNNIRVVSLDFPQEILSMFPGPTHGIEGIRTLLGVFGRPLACTPLKPMGLSVGELGALAGAFARGGVDIIKDDHGLGNQPFHPFRERIVRCQDAIDNENVRSGRATVYCPMLSGGFDAIEAQARQCIEAGVRGMLIAPMLVGFDTVRYLSQTYGAVVIGHPALTGTFFSGEVHGMTPAVLLGTMFRLLGADISVFPNAGGRFCFTKKECLDLAVALRAPLGSMKKAFPCPAGGLAMETIADVSQDYGADTVLLIGGSLLKRSSDVAGSAAEFMDRIRSVFPGCTG